MWGLCRSHRSGGDIRTGKRSFLFILLIVLLTSTLAAQNTDSIVQQINTQLGDTLCAFPLSQRVLSLKRPVVAGTLRIVRATLPAQFYPTLALDSSATRLYVIGEHATENDTIWVGFRYLNRPTQQTFGVYTLLDSVSPSDLPRWKQIQQEHSTSQKTSTSPPFILRGYAEREASLGESIQAPFAGRMHLELEGQLESGLRIAGELSDQSLPFQPDGTTTQVKALDRLYLRVSDTLWQAEGGDLELHTDNHFLYYNTPIQGLRYTNETRTTQHDTLQFDIALGVAKGEYAEVELVGQEGIQGPYRIYGSSSLLQVAAIAGSEYVYLDGVLLTRGYDKDYTIDYNLGEIWFTVQRPVRAGSRIHVKYEKASQRYTRYLLHGNARGTLRHGWGLELQTYVAHDAASTLQLPNNKQEALEGLTGLDPAQEVLRFLQLGKKTDGKQQGGYILVDTTVAATSYSLFRYVPAGIYDSVYTPTFRYTTRGGDYIQAQGENNEPIYVWRAPLNGKPQGNYAVGEELAPPKSHQLVQATVKKEHKHYKTQITIAYSHYDPNTLQTTYTQKKDGIATKARAEWRLGSLGQQTFWLGSEGRFVFRDFRAVQNYLPVDFMRNWGLKGEMPTDSWGDASLWLLMRSSRGVSKIGGNFFFSPHFRGFAFERNLDYLWRYFGLKMKVSTRRMYGDSLQRWVGQLHNEITLRSKFIQPIYFVDGEIQSTSQRTRTVEDDYRWLRTGLRTRFGDSTLYSTQLELAYRHDDATVLPTQQPRRHTWEATAQGKLNLQRYGNYTARLNYQHLTSFYTQQKSITTHVLLAQLGSQLALWRERIRILLQQELSTENTPEWQQHFIRVPDGQGRYTWIDANGDGIEQLDEFVLAAFRDQGRYVLQMVPSSTTRATRTSNLQLGINFTPRANGKAIDSLTHWYERVDLEVSTTLGQKRVRGNWANTLLHLGALSQALQAQRTLNTTFWFNKNSAPMQAFMGGTFSLQQQQLSQGRTSNNEHAFRMGVSTPDVTKWIADLGGEWQHKVQKIPYGTEQELNSRLWLLRCAVGRRYANTAEQRVEVRMTWLTVTKNPLPARMTECEYTLHVPLGKQFSGEVRLTYAYTTIVALRNNPLAYSLTRGYSDGHNLINHLTLRYKLSRHVELSASYELRKLGSTPIQQAGNFAVRTVF